MVRGGMGAKSESERGRELVMTHTRLENIWRTSTHNGISMAIFAVGRKGQCDCDKCAPQILSRMEDMCPTDS
jgi:hypothetical protein